MGIIRQCFRPCNSYGGRIVKFQDPVHGVVSLSHFFDPLLKSVTLYRLKSIQQTHFTPLKASDGFNRFNHSVGVFLIGNQWLTSNAGKLGLSQADTFHFLLACLLHDVSHLPYGHVLEGFYRVRHDELLADCIQTTLRNKISKSADLIGIKASVQRIIEIIHGTSNWPKDKLFHSLLKGATSFDKLDYVIRDACFLDTCSQPDLASENIAKLLHALSVEKGIIRLNYHCIPQNTIGYFNDIISTANYSSYFHWTTRIRYRYFYEALSVCELPSAQEKYWMKLDDEEFNKYLLKHNKGLLIHGITLPQWLTESETSLNRNMLAEYPISWDKLDKAYSVLPLYKKKTIRMDKLHEIELRICARAVKGLGEPIALAKALMCNGSFFLDIPPYPFVVDLLRWHEHQNGDSPASIRAFVTTNCPNICRFNHDRLLPALKKAFLHECTLLMQTI